MLSPLCGMDRLLGFMVGDDRDPRFVIMGADIADQGVLRGFAPVEVGAHHIGGGGLFLEESVIRALGESIERYAQIGAELRLGHTLVRSTRENLVGPALDARRLQFFAPEQYAAPGFPFAPLRPESVLAWIRAPSLVSGSDIWVPAQLVLVGYHPKLREGEPWLSSAVTTGSAAHTDQASALANALLELVQIDAAVGHWYSPASAAEIRLDERTSSLSRILANQYPRGSVRPRFYWLPSPDLPGFVVACVARRPSTDPPAVAIGLGGEMSLEAAMYKSLIECVGVVHLARLNLLRGQNGLGPVDASRIFDLDRNVAYYATGARPDLFDAKFGRAPPMGARDLPPDVQGGPAHHARVLVDGFAQTGKELILLDLTTPDVADLGFVALRAWSPDTLSLPLPSAPPVLHPRFRDFGGAVHREPHPYP